MNSLDFFSAFQDKKLILAVTVSGLFAGLAGWLSSDLSGMGHHLTESALKGNLVANSIIVFLVIRFFLTIANYGTGVPGGIFAPLLTLGSLLGLLVGQGANCLSPQTVPTPAVFGVVGMAALFSSIVRAPLTGIMLIVEMTGNYSLMLSLLASCIISYIVAEYSGELPIYEAMLHRDLRRAGLDMVLAEPAIMEFIIANNAPFAGKTIVELGLPPGCIVIRIFDGVREIVPKARTQLLEDMKITVLISPEAGSAAVQMLKTGLEDGHSNWRCAHYHDTSSHEELNRKIRNRFDAYDSIGIVLEFASRTEQKIPLREPWHIGNMGQDSAFREASSPAQSLVLAEGSVETPLEVMMELKNHALAYQP